MVVGMAVGEHLARMTGGPMPLRRLFAASSLLFLLVLAIFIGLVLVHLQQTIGELRNERNIMEGDRKEIAVIQSFDRKGHGTR